QAQRPGAQRRAGALDVEDAEDRAHAGFPPGGVGWRGSGGRGGRRENGSGSSISEEPPGVPCSVRSSAYDNARPVPRLLEETGLRRLFELRKIARIAAGTVQGVFPKIIIPPPFCQRG
ncbi:MAG TPA: hypothetical protein VF541_01680, partial [Longimicrobium sp.]